MQITTQDLGQELFLLQVKYYTTLKGQEKQFFLSYLYHECEVCQGWGVDSPTSTWAHDQRNLRDDSRCCGIPLPKEKDKGIWLQRCSRLYLQKDKDNNKIIFGFYSQKFYPGGKRPNRYSFLQNYGMIVIILSGANTFFSSLLVSSPPKAIPGYKLIENSNTLTPPPNTPQAQEPCLHKAVRKKE